jgi:hypothetical protein
MKSMKLLLTGVLIGFAVVLAGCTIYPSMDLGIDFDYEGGEFHARPNANVGITGRP